MDIAEVAKRSGLRASTLRYYEEKGLVHSVAPPGERRRFAPGVLDQLALIALGQSAGFSLDEIRSMFRHGNISIRQRAMAEDIFWHIIRKICNFGLKRKYVDIDNEWACPVYRIGMDSHKTFRWCLSSVPSCYRTR